MKVTTLFCNLEQLEQKKDDEKEREYFTEMPSKCYLEVTSLLLKRFVKNFSSMAF